MSWPIFSCIVLFTTTTKITAKMPRDWKMLSHSSLQLPDSDCLIQAPPARRSNGDTGFLSLLWDAVLFFFALWLIFIWKALTRATLPQSPRWPAESITTDCQWWSTCVWVPGGAFDLPVPPGMHSCAASRRDGWTPYLPNLNLILPPLVWALSWEVGSVVWIPPGWRKHWSQISHFMGQRFC